MVLAASCAGVVLAALAPAALAQPQSAQAAPHAATLGVNAAASSLPAPLSSALQRFAESWQAVDALTLTMHTSDATALLALRRDGTLAWQWFDSSQAAPPPGTVPDAMLYFANSTIVTRRGTFDRATASTRPNHCIVTPDAQLWTPEPGPSQLLLCPWPRLAMLAQQLTRTPDATGTLEGTIASVRSGSMGVAMSWDTTTNRLLTLERAPANTPVREQATYAYDARPTGNLPGANLPGSITLRAISGDDDSAPVPSDASRWTIARVAASASDADVLFDQSRWSMQRFDPATGKLFDASGAVVGGELNTSIAGLTDHIEKGRATSYTAVAKWGGIACVLLVLGVIVDMIRRRL